MSDIQFYEWLGGLIDADGSLYVSKQGYGSIEITMHLKEIQTLYLIKKKCQGQVLIRTGTHLDNIKKARWRLYKRESLVKLLINLSGNIRIKKRQLQFQKICEIYNIEYKIPQKLTYNNGWFSGFFCGAGSLYINKTNLMAVLSVSQKEENILKAIQYIFKGTIHYDISSTKWSNLNEIKIGWCWQCNNFNCEFLLDYFDKHSVLNPVKTAKLRGLKRFLFYKKEKYHLDINKKKLLLNYIKLFNKK